MTTDIGPPQVVLRDLGYLILKSQMIEHLLAVILATTRAEKDITPIEVARSWLTADQRL